MANATSTQLQELYVAYFGRAADPTGLDYWTASGITTAKFAADMYAQAEFQDAYGDLSVEAKVNQIYKNLFDREADVAGLTYWTQEINLGNLKVAEIANHLISAAQHADGNADDKTALANKTDAAIAYTAKVKETSAAILAYQPLATDPWDSGGNFAEAITYLSGIDKDTASTTAGIAASVTTIVNNGAPAPSETINLTTTTDVGAAFTSAGGKDTFVSTLAQLGFGDSVDGGSNSDTFNLSAAIDATGREADFTVKNIETFNVIVDDSTAGTAHTLTVNTNGIDSSLTLLGVSGTSATTQSDTVAFTNVDSGVALKISAADVDTTVTYVTAATSGTADSATVTFSGASATAAGDAALSYGATSGIETLNVASSGSANTVGDIIFGGTKIVVTGDQNLTVRSALDASVATIDASALSGTAFLSVITANFDDGEENEATAGVDQADITITTAGGNDVVNAANNTAGDELLITTGAGNDTVTIGAATVGSTTTNVGDVINGGTGTDTIVMTEAIATGLTTTTSAGISGFETLELNTALSGSLTTANVEAGIDTVTLAAAAHSADSGDIIFEAGARTLNIETSLLGTLTLADTGTATTDSLTINNEAAAADDMGDGEALVINGIETVTIDTTAVDTTSQDFGVITMTSDTGGTDTLKIIGSDAITTLAITAEIIDASGMSAQSTGFTFDQGTNLAVSVTSITGSAGSDRIVGDTATVINAGAGDDTITGGSGNDTINAEAGADTVTIGAGTDTVTLGAGNDAVILAATGDLSLSDSISGGDGTDSISLVEAVTATEAAGVSGFETLIIADGSTQDMAVFSANSGFTTIRQTNVAAADAMIFTNIRDEVTSVEVLDDDGNLSLSFDRLVDSTTNALTITGNGSDASSYTAITAQDEETLTITGGDAAAETLVITTLTSADVKTINLTGAATITITNAVGGGTLIETVDASSMAVAVDIDISNSVKAATMTGGTGINQLEGGLGKDTITGNALADTLIGNQGADTITGGTGADSITGGEGLDSLSGGTGVDTFVIVSEGTTNYDTISDFTNATDGTEDDILMIDVSAINGDSLMDSTGTVVTASTTHAVVTYDGSTALTSNAIGACIVKASALSYNNFSDVSTAINAANITFDGGQKGFAIGQGVIFTYFDVDDGYASVGYMESDVSDVFDDGNTYVEFARITMTSTEYGNFDADNFDLL